MKSEDLSRFLLPMASILAMDGLWILGLLNNLQSHKSKQPSTHYEEGALTVVGSRGIPPRNPPQTHCKYNSSYNPPINSDYELKNIVLDMVNRDIKVFSEEGTIPPMASVQDLSNAKRRQRGKTAEIRPGRII